MSLAIPSHTFATHTYQQGWDSELCSGSDCGLLHICLLRWQNCYKSSELIRPYLTRVLVPACLPAGDELPGRPAQDLVFVIKQAPHSTFMRQGDNLVAKVSLTMRAQSLSQQTSEKALR